MHYKTIRIEGFEIQKLLSQCLKEGIRLKNVRILNDCEFLADIDGKDWSRLTRLAGSKYRLSVTREKGFKPLILRILSNRSAIAGFILFLVIVFLQTSFISEIRVYGYESLTEREILAHLKEAGLFVGCSRSIDPDRVEIEMYRSLDTISWIGITFKGGLAEVTVVEGTEPVDRVEDGQPCHIVAAKEGYIEKIIAREGKEAVVKDDFVRVGDVLISGILEIEDKTYSRDPDSVIYRYVHAEGEVYAKTVYRFICYQETHNLEKRKTGRSIPGIRLTLGNRTWNTSGLIAPFDTSLYEEKKILDLIWPFPVEIAVNRVWELELYREKRTREQIEKQAKRQTRELIRNNIPASAQILNKSLKFLPEENIIKVTIMIEALEQIGAKRAFIPREIPPDLTQDQNDPQ
ncbi:MAG: sporulation protein YqfD [Anaerovoracaceae bacterium]|jgi:similar to stage IV sporulation protein